MSHMYVLAIISKDVTPDDRSKSDDLEPEL
jgi:hypothetical protein